MQKHDEMSSLTNFISFVILLTLAHTFKSQVPNDSDTFFIGNVKVIQLESKSRYTDDNSRSTWYTHHTSNCEFQFSQNKISKIYFCNQNGEKYLSQQNVYDSTGSLFRTDYYNDSGELTSTHNYFYDDAGRIKKLQYITLKKRGFEEILLNNPGYSDYKHISETNFHYTVSENTLEVIKTKDKRITEEIVEKYDSRKNVIRRLTKSFNDDSSVNTNLESFTYDNLGRIVSSQFVSDYISGTDKYDAFGNPIERTRSDEKGNKYEPVNIVYEFDSSNNWIKKSEYEGSEVFRITSRVIIYD